MLDPNVHIATVAMAAASERDALETRKRLLFRRPQFDEDLSLAISGLILFTPRRRQLYGEAARLAKQEFVTAMMSGRRLGQADDSIGLGEFIKIYFHLHHFERYGRFAYAIWSARRARATIT